MISVLVVDDDRSVRETLSEFFEETRGYTVRSAATASEGRRAAAAHAPDVVLVDLRLPDASGLTLLEALHADDPELGVIVLTGHADVATAVRAMQQGALDFLEKPVDLETLDAAVQRAAELVRLRREVVVLRAQHGGSDAGSGGTDDGGPSLERLIDLAARNDDVPVLIVGETGTGKGYVAHRIHERSARAAQPFVEVNGASLNATFLESELFGHERGAFTDARQAKRGLFEVALRGTLFLDEVGEVAPDVQPKLLTVLEEGRFRRLGGTAELRSEARVLAATNQPLRARVLEGRFRADLFYRLQVLTLSLPPLRARRDELRSLTAVFLPRGARLSAAAHRAIERYDWPGNLRELKHTLWRAALLADGEPVEPRHLSLPDLGRTTPAGPETLADAERRAIHAALRATDGNRVRAAQLLGIARSTLLEKLKRLAGDRR